VVKYHYLHRKASCSFAFGLYGDSELIGICLFGIPASHNVCMLFGEDESQKVLELTRLWTIDDGRQKESYFISRALRQLPKEYDIIISYADASQGHCGIIYQATNWIYFGLTEKRTNRIAIDGTTAKHNRHECMKKEGTFLIERPQKHRYLFLRGSKPRKKYLMSKFAYRDKIQSYPKSDKILANPQVDFINQANLQMEFL
jgi:hypothetical protein